MKILGYIGTYNESVTPALQGLLNQTQAVSDIIIVDNASERPVVPGSLPPQARVLRVARNIGPNSAVRAGLTYAVEHGYDWMWLLESDGAPHKDALEQLLGLYRSFNAATQAEIGILCCTQVLLPTSKLFHGRRMTPGGPRPPRINPSLPYCEVDSLLWNGALFKIDAVRAVGLPRSGQNHPWQDLSYDYGDTEYTYRIRAAGYRLLTHRFSFVDQRVGRSKQIRVLGRPLVTTNHPPRRRYLFFRNLVFFWLHIYPHRHWPTFGAWFLYRLGVTIAGIVVFEDHRLPKIAACFKGIWHGIRKNIHHTC
ncbi:glycosyltransferase [Candidatus Nitrospira bockiana]